MAPRGPFRVPPALLLTLLALAPACGGGGTSPTPPPPPPPPGPVPVASVALDQTDLGMVPQFTVQLTATTRDASGATLTGRTVTWQSSAGTVASVSPAGLVTGLTTGTATITATSEGRSASASVTVRDGAAIGPAGGTVTAVGGKARITIPAGALTATLPISVTPLPAPPSPAGVVTGTAFELGPTGTTFAQPVTLEFSYPSTGAVDSLQALYALSRLTGDTWIPLPTSSGGRPGFTVTAQTSSFSSYGVVTHFTTGALPVTPANPSVFFNESISLSAPPVDPALVPPGTQVTRAWNGPSGVSVSQSGVVTGLVPGGPYLVQVTDTWAVTCPGPGGCFIGYFNYGTPQQQPVYAPSLTFSSTGQAEVVVGLRPVAEIVVAPAPLNLAPGQKATASATLKDASGSTLSQQFRTIAWSTTNALVASVAQTGEVTAVAPGTATISAASGTATGSIQVTVAGSSNPVVTVEVTPAEPTIEVGATIPMTATARDANGQVVSGLPVTWISLTTGVATVSQTGVVTAIATGSSGIGATVGGITDGTFVTVVPPYPLVQGSPATGDYFSCLRRINSTIWCWGAGNEGQLGNGTTAAVQLVPAPASGTGFTALDAGANHSCALDAGGQAWCWGRNVNGEVGDNSTTDRTVPTPVAGGRTFAKIFAGQFVSCGLEAGGDAWCWGASGQVGDGQNEDRSAPVAVIGGQKFVTMALGWSGACGLTQAGATWCWGYSNTGTSLGDGVTPSSLAPVQVATGHQFVSLAGGSGLQVCGLKANGEAWCWGRGSEGQLGDGSLTNRATPVKVATSVKFTAISAGSSHTCALAEDGTAWCWGLRGNLGVLNQTALPLYVTTPIQVFGNRQYTEISSGGGHTCARAADGTWCWGSNFNGQLGSGASGGVGTFGPPVKVRFP